MLTTACPRGFLLNIYIYIYIYIRLESLSILLYAFLLSSSLLYSLVLSFIVSSSAIFSSMLIYSYNFPFCFYAHLFVMFIYSANVTYCVCSHSLLHPGDPALQGWNPHMLRRRFSVARDRHAWRCCAKSGGLGDLQDHLIKFTGRSSVISKKSLFMLMQ